MTAKDLKELKDGSHQIRVFGMSKILTKKTVNIWLTHYLINEKIFIHINPVSDSLILISNVQGINFERSLLATDLVMI